MTNGKIRVGGASGFWGDAAGATAQLLAGAQLDYIIYDYLAEVTMSIMARARRDDPGLGYAVDFVTRAMKPNLREIAKRGVRIIANAGGLNPVACAEALRRIIREHGLDLKVGTVLGDDLWERRAELAARGLREAYSGVEFPPQDQILSINAYLGAFPIAAVLDEGADIVVTGRCVDSALTLAAGIHAFRWGPDDLDQLASGTLAGHIIECGVQVTGGNFTDWDQVVDDCDRFGYPVATIEPDGAFEVTKAEGSAGLVSVGTVAEQMVYEIGDPGAYVVPDVSCDFTGVQISQVGPDRVRVWPARGFRAPDDYKVSLTYADGYRASKSYIVYGPNAEAKARRFSAAVLRRAADFLRERNLAPLSETNVQFVGLGQSDPACAAGITFVLSVRHPESAGIGVFLKEATTEIGLAVPAGLTSLGGGARAKPAQVVRLFSFMTPRRDLDIEIELDGARKPFHEPERADTPLRPATVRMESDADLGPDPVAVPLYALAWGRSGDKGNKVNIGIIARKSEYLPFIRAMLTEAAVANWFAGDIAPTGSVDRFELPGISGLNFLLHDALGGGGMASLRMDPQGKVFAQRLLGFRIPLPAALVLRDQLLTCSERTET